MLKYPALFEPDSGGFCVSFRDVPEALTCGDTLEEAQEMAADALLTAMDFYLEDNRPVAIPSEVQDGEYLVALPEDVSAKVMALNASLSAK